MYMSSEYYYISIYFSNGTELCNALACMSLTFISRLRKFWDKIRIQISSYIPLFALFVLAPPLPTLRGAVLCLKFLY